MWTGLLAVVLVPALAWADQAVDKEMQSDVVLRALVSELERNQAGLKLEDLERPYFIEYALSDATRVYVTAELGSVTGKNVNRFRSLQPEVRVGSYELDNTNFGSGYGRYYGGSGPSAMPIEDDYNAIRQAIWWATDRGYKDAVETLAQKKAFMESKLIKDKPEDFAQQPPAVYLEPRGDIKLTVEPLEKLAVPLSAVFRQYPQVQQSGVTTEGGSGNKYLVNSEGTRIRIASTSFSISVTATVQADDGMKMSDSFTVYARKLEDLPALPELTKRCTQMVERLLAAREAPLLDSYTGPVLFEAEPATELFAGQFAQRFAGGQRPVGSSSNPDDFENKLGKRILPGFLNVVDNPAQETINGQLVMGNYAYDDEGVKAQAVSLVKGGTLEALLMSRNPSKQFKQSNGHGRGSYGSQAGVGCLLVTSDEGADGAALRQRLLEAAAEESLDFGLRVVALGNVGDGGGYGGYYGRARFGGPRGGGTAPLAMYKVYPDGREEMVRGAEIARVELKAFKNILAAGDTPYVRNSGSGTQGRTVAVPALLFEELDLAKMDRDFDKPPLLPAPLARGK